MTGDELHSNLIAGEWVGEPATPNVNPSDTDDIVGLYASATEAETQAAIAAAQRAFPSWSRSSLLERQAILRKTADELMARRDELGRLLAREEGKALPDAIGEATRASYIFDFFAAETLRLAGETIASVRPGVGVEITREAVGVVGIITPWNFPIAIPAWKIAPALCYGATIVFKPAHWSPAAHGRWSTFCIGPNYQRASSTWSSARFGGGARRFWEAWTSIDDFHGLGSTGRHVASASIPHPQIAVGNGR